MRMARERRPRSLPSCVLSAIPSTSLHFLGEHRFHCTQDTSIGAGMLDVKSERIGRAHDYSMRMHENTILSYTVAHYFVSRVVVCLVSKVVPASTHSDRSTPRIPSISPGLPLFRCLVACLARSLFSTRRAHHEWRLRGCAQATSRICNHPWTWSFRTDRWFSSRVPRFSFGLQLRPSWSQRPFKIVFASDDQLPSVHQPYISRVLIAPRLGCDAIRQPVPSDKVPTMSNKIYL